MNVQLRKRHRVMWMAIGIILPLLCLQALESIPVRSVADIPRHSCPAAMTSCVLEDPDHIHSESFDAKLTVVDSMTLFEVKVDQPLKSAFTLAYIGSEEINQSEWKLLGAIHGMGTYKFQTSELFNDLVVPITFYDKLNDKILHTLSRTTE